MLIHTINLLTASIIYLKATPESRDVKGQLLYAPSEDSTVHINYTIYNDGEPTIICKNTSPLNENIFSNYL